MTTGFHQSVTWRLAELESRLAAGAALATDRDLIGALIEDAAGVYGTLPRKEGAGLARRLEDARAALGRLAIPRVPDAGVAVWHGDCRAGLAALPDRSADAVFADPPYFTGNTTDQTADYTISQQLADQQWTNFHADWDNQWSSWTEYQEWCAEWLAQCRRVLKLTGSLFVCGSYHNIPRVGVVLQDQGWYVNRWISWFKPNAFPNRRMDKPTAATEIVIWARPSRDHTGIYHRDVARFYGGGKNLSDMWAIPMDAARARRLKALGFHHPSKKPPAIVERALRLSCPKDGAVVVDPFGGSGTTGEVVQQQAAAGWRGLLMDASAEYVEGMRRILSQPCQQRAALVAA